MRLIGRLLWGIHMTRSNLNAPKRNNLASSASISLQTHELLDKVGLPPTPKNYEAFYFYVAGENDRLIADIDAAIDENGQLRQSELDYLYSVHFPKDSEYVSLGNSLGEQINDTFDLVRNAFGSTSSYGDCLDQTRRDLTDLSEPAEIRSTVAAILNATKQMSETFVGVERGIGAICGEDGGTEKGPCDGSPAIRNRFFDRRVKSSGV